MQNLSPTPPLSLENINEQLRTSKRVFPIDMNQKTKTLKSRKNTVPYDKLTVLEDSKVSIRPRYPADEMRAARRYKSTNRRKNPSPHLVSTIANVHERDQVQKKRLDELLLSHVDTLTRSGSSRNFLPQIRSTNQNKGAFNPK